MRGKVAEALRRRREWEDGQESGSERWGWRVVSARRRGKVSAKEARKHGMASMEECGMATPPWAAGRVSWKAVHFLHSFSAAELALTGRMSPFVYASLHALQAAISTRATCAQSSSGRYVPLVFAEVWVCPHASRRATCS